MIGEIINMKRILIENIDYIIKNNNLILLKEINSKFYRMKIKVKNKGYQFYEYGILEENNIYEIYFEDMGGECHLCFNEILEEIFQVKNENENIILTIY